MMVAMRTVSDQLTEVLAAVRPAGPLDVVLADAEGTILAQDVVAPGDVPAIDVAGCDGYAVRLAQVDDLAGRRRSRPHAGLRPGSA